MALTPVRLVLRRTLTQIRHVRPVRPGSASGAVREVYRQVERDFGMLAPPVALHSPAPGPLAASWMMLRETLVAQGESPRAVREGVAAAVSLRNTCPYCVEVHTATLGGLAGPGDAAAIADDRIDAIGDRPLREIVAWIRGTGELHHLSETVRAELIGVAVTFEYLNRVVNVFLEDSPLPPDLPSTAQRYARAALGRVLRPDRAGPRKGLSLDLLPPALLPADLSWAGGDLIVGAAFARASTAIDTAGRRTLPDSVRDVVLGALSEWDGRPPGLSRDWVEPFVSTVSEVDRPPARLALLTAMASYQVDDGVVDSFRRLCPGDGPLVDGVAWASLAGARRRGELLEASARNEKTDAPLSKEN